MELLKLTALPPAAAKTAKLPLPHAGSSFIEIIRVLAHLRSGKSGFCAADFRDIAVAIHPEGVSVGKPT